MDPLQNIVYHIELHSVEGIRECFAKGVDPNAIFEEKPLFDTMLNMYTRSPRFKACVKAFVENGLHFEDKVLLSVLLDDAAALENHLQQDPSLISKTVTLDCTYTPLKDARLLHVCAEYNHVACAEVLVRHGADVDAKAGTDEHGFGGQTPIFHTVNQNRNQSKEMMEFLLSQSAGLHYTVKGLIWGKGYPWETFIPSVNPVSYAMMGLLPQMHRDERTTAAVVSTLMKHAYGIDYTPGNVPCRYLL